MSYYEDKANVENYIKMAEGYDGKLLIEALRKYLKPKSSVLEIGIGEGKDLLLLSEHYTVTGSDYSSIFVNRFRESHTDIDVLQLDAVTLDTNFTFDALYSNKVLYHLTQAQLKQSFERQLNILNPKGIALHSFWIGDDNDSMHGLHFEYYTEDTLRPLIPTSFEVLAVEIYTEMDENDSLYIVLQKRDDAS